MEEFEEFEDDQKDETFFQKLENSVGTGIKIFAYVVFAFGILYSLVGAYAILDNPYINDLLALIVIVAGVFGSYISFAVIIFILHIGSNIKKIREMMEDKDNSNISC
ncbi:MAG: hypothetical protein NC111_03855 [Bacteroides sp.]|nr:hypothetical protein [Bacteroides sp.]MCM1413929.1 hypothetical protein [Bacteroides sp.]MCM1471644.1 hypothetical protein [Bacteroides sp.]